MEQVGKILMDMDFNPDQIFLDKKAIPSSAIQPDLPPTNFQPTEDIGMETGAEEILPPTPDDLPPDQMSDEDLLSSIAQI